MTESSYKLSPGLLGLAIFVSTLGVGNVVPFLPIYANQMGASGFMLGIIFSSFSASRALIMPYIGILSDRYGRVPFIITGLIGSALVALLMIAAASPWQLAFSRMGQGVFAAMILPVCMALLADATPTGREGRAFGGFNTALFLGLGLGPLMGGIIFDLAGVATNFIFWAGLSFSSALLVLWQIKEPPKTVRTAAASGWGGQLMLIKDRTMLSIFLCRVGSAASWGCNIAFLPLLCMERDIPSYQVGILLAANVLTMTGMQKPAGFLADRWPRITLAAGGQIIAGAIRIVMPMAHTFEGLFGLVIFGGIFAGLGAPALTALTVERGKSLDAAMGVTMSFFAMAMSVGIFIGPVSAGALGDAMGLASIFWLAGIANIAGALILILNHFLLARRPPQTTS